MDTKSTQVIYKEEAIAYLSSLNVYHKQFGLEPAAMLMPGFGILLIWLIYQGYAGMFSTSLLVHSFSLSFIPKFGDDSRIMISTFINLKNAFKLSIKNSLLIEISLSNLKCKTHLSKSLRLSYLLL